jgi:hypothetical protein
VTALSSDSEEASSAQTGKIETLKVAAAHAGWP